jgi:hypothetical protein
MKILCNICGKNRPTLISDDQLEPTCDDCANKTIGITFRRMQPIDFQIAREELVHGA